MTFPWKCPFCGLHGTVSEANVTERTELFDNGNKYGQQAVIWKAITCPNPACGEYTFAVSVFDAQGSESKPRHFWRLVPQADMKVLPDRVPEPVASAYREACRIAVLSPRASATLSRRCLREMIRDRWGVGGTRLSDAIGLIQGKLAPATWEAIERVQARGNIADHMAAGPDLIVDVDPQEARLLIQLVETLVDAWYAAPPR
jgi:hypothetical protein